MKLTARQIPAFLKAPDPSARVVLVYGPDSGLVRERLEILGKHVVSDLNDPFNAVSLTEENLLDDTARLFDEAKAMSLMGGARLIRIDGASDKLTVLLKDYLEDPSSENMVLIEGGNLGPKSPLRALCEKSTAAAALPCYVEGTRDVQSLITEIAGAQGYSVQRDALSWLALTLAGDRRKIRNEMEKLLLYMGDDKVITLETAKEICGEVTEQSYDDLVNAVALGHKEMALSALNILLYEGTAPIAILRVLQNHFRRLHMTHALLRNGLDADTAMKQLSPPVFFKQADTFRAALNKWQNASLQTVLQRLADVEVESKKTGVPTEILLSQTVLGIALRAARP